jgi:hypothetical protein
MRGPCCLMAVLLAMGLLLVACGDDDAAEQAGFTEQDLSGLVLGPSQAPPHTEVSDISGPDLLERQGGLERLLQQLREVGFVADHGVQFEPTRRGASFVEALALVFEDEDAAGRGLDLLLRFHLDSYEPAEEIPAAWLGEESWGVRGEFEPGIPSGIFASRTGNVIQLATVSAEDQRARIDEAREVALQLEELGSD